MPSPFPGMDPFLESQGFWQDFHFRIIAYCSDFLSSSLPDNYAALVEVPERWIEIKRLPDLALVTVIEILSPTNKSGPGRGQYLQKRRELLDQPVHLVEIDLLLRGQRLPMGDPLPPGDYYAFVSRAEKRDCSDVYAWSIRRVLPAIPIPLSPPDPDLSLDLAAVVARAYDQGRYQRLIHYADPLDLPLASEDQSWLRSVVSHEST